MKKLFTVMSVIFIVVALFLTGCGSSSNNITHGGDNPPPPPPPQDITVKINGTCIYPDGVPIVGVTVNENSAIVTDVNGNFEIEVIVKKGQEYLVPFAKEKFIFDGLKLTIDDSGNPIYDNTVIGFIPMTKGAKYRVSTPQITPNTFTYYIAISPDEKFMYAANGQQIYRINLNTMQSVVIAGGGTDDSNGVAGEIAKFTSPRGLVVSPDGTTLYVTDYELNKIKKITNVDTAQTAENTIVYTMAGTGTSGANDNCAGSAAQFRLPQGLAISPDSNILYVCDSQNFCIRKVTGIADAISADNTQVSTIAGQKGIEGQQDGTGNQAKFHQPLSIAVSKDGTTMYVTAANTASDSNLRKITGLAPSATAQNVTVTTLAGSIYGDNTLLPISGDQAIFRSIIGLTLSQDEDTAFITDRNNNKIKVVKNIKNATTASQTTVDLIAGTGIEGNEDGYETTATFNAPIDLQLLNNESVMYVACYNNPIRRIIATE